MTIRSYLFDLITFGFNKVFFLRFAFSWLANQLSANTIYRKNLEYYADFKDKFFELRTAHPKDTNFQAFLNLSFNSNFTIPSSSN